MNNVWKKPGNEYASSAKVVDGNLIISMPDAINPIVWRMELGSVKASALEVRGQENGQFILFLKTPKGDVHDIAPFENKDLAVQALMRVSQALQGAQGKITPAAITAPQEIPSHAALGKSGGSGYKWLLALGGVLIVIILFAYLGSLMPPSAIDSGTGVAGQTDAPSGVPQSADDMLRGF